MASVCKGIRRLALDNPTLWQQIPEATPDTIGDFTRFFDRSRKLGMDLWISRIEDDDISYVSQIVRQVFHRVRSCLLHFEGEDIIGSPRLVEIHCALLREAYKLERLHLTVDAPQEPVEDLPRWFTECFSAPNLVYLDLTAFTLVRPCPSFFNVTEVLASVAALFPYRQEDIPVGEQPWANASLHTHFPAIRSLKLHGIDPGPVLGDSARPLILLPYIDRPLDELHLVFNPFDMSFEDPDAVRWITEGTRNVRRLVVHHPECVGVRDAALMSLAGAPLSLRIQFWNEEFMQLTARTPAGRERAVRFVEADLKAHLTKILGSAQTPVKELSLPDSSTLLAEIGPLLAEYRRLETLGLVYNGGPFPSARDGARALPSVRTLRLESAELVEVDTKALAAFVAAVVPKATTILLSHLTSLTDPHVLPPAISVV